MLTFLTLYRTVADQFSAPDTPQAWIVYGGALGLALFGLYAFLREWIVPGSRYRRLEAELNEAQQREQELQKFLREEAIPLLSRVQDVLVRHLEDRAWDERLQRRRQK